MAASQEMFLPGAMYFGFISLVPLLVAVDRKRPRTAFFLAFITFFIYKVLPMHWLSQYGYPALFALITMEGVAYGIAFMIYNFIRGRNNWQDPYLVILPMLISIVEFKQTIGPWAFPWPLIANSQWANLIFIQSASVWGTIGLSFLLVWINRGVYELFLAFPNHQKVFLKKATPLLLVMILNLVYGYGRLADNSYINGVPHPTTIVQRNISTDVIWTSNFNEQAWEEYNRLTQRETNNSVGEPGFVLWPENAVPDLMDSRLPEIQSEADSTRKAFILGTLTEEPEWANPYTDYDQPWYHIYNSVVAVSPDMGITGTYSKIHLVPFGETIPMREYLAVLDYPWGDKNLSEGRTINALPTTYGGVGAMICYESFFPQISRKLVLDGAKYLFLASNTSWFGESVATWQHSRFDVFRAVENGCFFARAATTGVSSVIDPRGRILQETEPFKTEAFTIDIYPRRNLHFTRFFKNMFPDFTFYTVIGDWISYISLIWLIMTMMKLFRPKSAKHISETIAYIEN
jgi:apolipoprotein N-acyltransferase